MRFVPLLGLILASAAFAQDTTQDSPSAYHKLKPFPALEQRVGGSWVAVWNVATGTPRAIYGTGLPLEGWRENSLEEARRHALAALDTHGDLLKLGSSTFRESIGARMGRTWSFKFDQYFQDLPCIGGRADVRVNMKGVLAMMGSTAWQIPADFDTVPTLDELEAQARAWIALDQRRTEEPQPGQPRKNRLVIWGDVFANDTAPFYLAWEIPVSNVDRIGQGPIGRYYIDAHTGAVLHYQTDKHECGFAACRNPHHGLNRLEEAAPPAEPLLPVPTTVTVMAWTRTPTLSAIGAPTNVPLPGVDVNVPGLGTFRTDAAGQISIDITSPVTINLTSLGGRHLQPVQDSSSSLPAASVTVTPGVPATLQVLTSGSSQQAIAHSSTYFWTDSANEWARSILGNSPELDTADQVVPSVNVVALDQQGTQIFCNAYYTNNTINFYPLGGACNNTAFSSVIVHEWGHGLDARYGGISNNAGDGLSEGWGDILGIYLGDNPVVGIDFRTNGGFVRTALNNRLYTSLTGATGVHASGEVWMGFAWMVRENLRAALGTPQAISISEDIVVGSIVADAQNQIDAVREVFVADDNDGNLFNGTPHYAELSAAATARALPFPQFQPVTVQHADLANTTERYKSRLVLADGIVNDTGSLTELRLVYSAAGGPTQTHVMRPTGTPGQYRGVLPGLSSGLVRYHIEGTSTTGTGRYPIEGEVTYVVETPPTTGAFVPFFTETFETGAPGWTSQAIATQNDWQVGSPAGRSGTSQGVAWADPAAAANGTDIYGNDLGNTIGTTNWNGSYAANVENVLMSPVLNCSNRTGVILQFSRWLTVEEGIFDQATIVVNGVEVYANPLLGNLVDSSWQTFTYRLPMADNNPSVQIEWRLKTDGGLQLGGWNIDDVVVGTETVPQLPASLQMLPPQSTAGQTVNLAIRTQGQRLFVLVVGDTAGPTSVSGFPTADVGGALDFLVGFTDVAGFYNLSFTSFGGMPNEGFLMHSQVLVFEPGNTFSLSNSHLNLFAQ
ncbi:MAG: M36 family metallopeptidase [Planctomycetota bacterium]